MIIYSITYSVELRVERDWMGWMHLAHIPRIMDTGYFKAYRFHRLVDPPAQKGTKTYNVQFTCESLQELAAYKNDSEAEHLGMFEERYKDQVLAFQTVLEHLEF